jgi:hypothetical protein
MTARWNAELSQVRKLKIEKLQRVILNEFVSFARMPFVDAKVKQWLGKVDYNTPLAA